MVQIFILLIAPRPNTQTELFYELLKPIIIQLINNFLPVEYLDIYVSDNVLDLDWVGVKNQPVILEEFCYLDRCQSLLPEHILIKIGSLGCIHGVTVVKKEVSEESSVFSNNNLSWLEISILDLFMGEYFQLTVGWIFDQLVPEALLLQLGLALPETPPDKTHLLYLLFVQFLFEFVLLLPLGLL